MNSWRTRLFSLVKMGVIVVLVLFGLIQLVPYGRNHTNPPVTQEPNWDSPETRALAVDACFDCHSNETEWPWYSHIAPISWLVQHDVDDGRRELNFSAWNERYNRKLAKDGSEVVEEGEMPLAIFLPTHPEARLTKEQKTQLADGLAKTAQ